MKDPISLLIPRPREIARKDGRFAWSANVTICLEEANEADRFAAETLMKACEERKIAQPKIAVAASGKITSGSGVILAGDPCRFLPLLQAMREEGLKVPPEVADEGYILHVTPKRILIIANTPSGVFYGFQTLIQLLSACGGNEIPALTITDWPTVPQRGISMDFARGEVYTVEAVKADIRRLAHYKMNFLVLYLENAFLFPSHPDIGENRDRITTEDALELSEYARHYHIEVSPCMDSPGHLERMLTQPQYAHLSEGTDTPGLQMVINVAHEETYPLLRDMYTDLCNAFPARTHYMGGDEAVALGKGASKPQADLMGAHNLYVRHVKEIHKVLAEHGKRMVVWGDPFEPDFFKPFGMTNYGIEALYQLPRDIIIAPWHYGRVDEFAFGKTVRDLGFDLHLWDSMDAHNGMFPNPEGVMENTETYIRFAHEYHALCALHSNWGDRNCFREYNWPGIIHFAEWAWENPGRPGEELFPLAAESFYGVGTGDLAETHRFLGGASRYLPWANQVWESATLRLFYGLVEPFALDEAKQKDLANFRSHAAAARKAFDKARSAASREVPNLDFLAFALDQFDTLGDLVECRHLLAQSDADGRAKARQMLEKLTKSLAQLQQRYEKLWHQARLPLGLEPNKEHFAKLISSAQAALKGLSD